MPASQRRHRLSNGHSCRRPDPRPPRCALSQRYATLSRADRRTRPPRCLTHTGGASYAPPSLRGSMATIFAPSASDLVELEELAARFGVFLDLPLDVSEPGARPEERRVGQAWARTCRSWWAA